jgi:hypothetical protein
MGESESRRTRRKREITEFDRFEDAGRVERR